MEELLELACLEEITHDDIENDDVIVIKRRVFQSHHS